ncbi:MAG TPA: sensor histidine kinase [Thermoanaerobaculia bacterium]|nr:sensor histidine kinase [Thermoanaerobaculia bacterium]
MTLLRSFRSRLLLGAVLAAVGLLGIAHVVSLVLIRRFPITLRFGNGTLLVIFALVLILAGVSQVHSGLSPFDRLRARLAAVRDGDDRRVDGSYPTEVQPLVSDLNALLEHREAIVSRAEAKAGDLAHGLKTPLAVLALEADRAEAAGQGELAAAIRLQVERMRRQIDHHLAHARATATGAAPGARCSVADSAAALARTLLRLHADRGLAIEVRVPPGQAVRGRREDLDEMLGNLLDNACQWARSRVVVESSAAATEIVIVVDDDGPGLDPAMRSAVLQRGVRADEAAPGSGLGLAIVRDLAELYGGAIALDRSPAGGLRVSLRLPAG